MADASKIDLDSFGKADARLIAAAPTLLALAKKQQEEIKRLRAALDIAKEFIDNQRREAVTLDEITHRLECGPLDLHLAEQAFIAIRDLRTELCWQQEEIEMLRKHIANIHNKVRHDFAVEIEAASYKAFKAMSGIEVLRKSGERK